MSQRRPTDSATAVLGPRGDLRRRVTRTPVIVISFVLLFTVGAELVHSSFDLGGLFVPATFRLTTWVNVLGALLGFAFLLYARREPEDGDEAEAYFLRGVEWLSYGATLYSLAHIHVSGCFSTVMFGTLFIPLAPAAWVLPWPRVVRLAGFQLAGYGLICVANATGTLTYAPIFERDATLDVIHADFRMRAVISATIVVLYVIVLTFLRSFRVVLDRQATGLGDLVDARTAEIARANQAFATRAASLRRAHYALVERNREVERQRETLSELSRVGALGQLAASIAHELNQPLGAIELRGAVARRTLRKPEPKQASIDASLDAIDEAIERARSIVGGLRRLHEEDAEHTCVALRALVEDTVALLEPVARRDRITLETDERDAEVHVRGDGSQLRQVVYNLVNNALQVLTEHGARPSAESPAGAPMRHEGPPRVVVAWRRDGDHVVLEVEDNGPGVPEGADVFAAFVSHRAGGLGVGLALSRSIVDHHRGTLTHRPRPGGGAVFTMRLPHVPEGA